MLPAVLNHIPETSQILLQYGKDTDKIVEQIKSRQTFLKIILKTFNDSFFLEKWIKHHANIVGLENLIIFDNMSNDNDVFAIYEKYKELSVFQFATGKRDAAHGVPVMGGRHNQIHDRKIFNSLYDALQSSCQYMLFIDTDEFLVWLDKDRWYADSSILDKLLPLKGAIPTTHIYNYPNHDDIFSIKNEKQLISNRRWGKPFVPTQLSESASTRMISPDQNRVLIHNVQFPKVNFWSTNKVNNFFLLHFTTLSSDQRIKVNKNKLIQHGYCTKTDSLDTILKINLDRASRLASRLINEIKDCVENQYHKKESQDIPAHCFRLMPDGTIDFADNRYKAILKKYITKCSLFCPRPPRTVQNEDAK